MISLVSLAVGLLYGFTLGRLAGMLAGALCAFALFAFRVATFPIYPETMGQRRDRERFEKQIAGMLLICAVFGLALAEALK